jgi:glycosyltransferase involved in cell wall biosynthesis
MTLSVSVILLAYRQQGYVEPAIASVLAQTHPRMEIILSDDCSPDDTHGVMQRLAAGYDGPHRVIVNRTAGNRGIVGHFNEAVAMASGDVIVYLAGDDIATPDRVAALVEALERRPDLAFVESRYVTFTDTDRPEDLLDGLARETAARSEPPALRVFDMDDYRAGRSPWLSSSTRAFRRELFLRFPPLDPGLASEDSSSALRLLYLGKAAQIDAPLLLKRAHASNLTGPEALKKLDFDRIGRQYLADAHHAESLGLLDRAGREAFEAWAADRIERRKLRVLFDLDYPTLTCLLTQILPARSLRPREKIYAIRRCLSGILGRRR